MRKLKVFGAILVLASILFQFSYRVTGFSIFDNYSAFNPLFLITFLLGITFLVISGKNVTGGLEKALDDDVVGVITFVRHGEKDKEGNLTKVGREQAKKLGTNFKEIYNTKNEGNLYLATSSSPADRAYETVKEIIGVESKYNKPIVRDKRLVGNFGEDVLKKYHSIVSSRGENAAGDWYINSKHGEDVAERFADFLESNKEKLSKLKNKKFHYIAGTHAGFPEALLKRVMINDKDEVGFDAVKDIGGTLDFAEPVNFLLKKDGTYQVNFRDEVYNVDMNKLNNLAKK